MNIPLRFALQKNIARIQSYGYNTFFVNFRIKEYMKGQTIIEVMVGLAVGIIILSAVTTAVLTSLNNVRQSSSQDQTGSAAAEGLEIVRKMRDTELAAFKNLEGTYCLSSSCTSLSSQVGDACGRKVEPCGENVGTYVREVTIEKNASSCRLTPAPTDVSLNGTKVSVIVSWKDAMCQDPDNSYCKSSNFDSCLFPVIQQ